MSAGQSDLLLSLIEQADDATLDRLAELLAPRIGGAAGGLLKPDAAAERLGIHVKTLTDAARAGRVTGASRVGRHWRFDPAALAILDDAPPAAPSTRRPTPRKRAESSIAEAIRGQ